MPTGCVDSLAYGPHGIVRHEGKVHFVRHVAPGDVVEWAVSEDRGTYAYGDLVRVVEPGPARRTPPCPYLPRCGGCPWQHIDYGVQLAAKEQSVRDHLARIGGLREARVLPIIPSPDEYHYRRRISLRVEQQLVGYSAAASHDVVPVATCLLAAPELDGGIELAQDWVARIRTTIKRIEIAAAGAEVVFAAQAEGPFADADAAATETYLTGARRVAGIVLHGRRWRRQWGRDAIPVDLPTLGLVEVGAGQFVQVNAGANAALVAAVLDAAACRASDTVVDLYAGAGNLSLPLAQHVAHVTAVERAAGSVRDGRRSAQRLQLRNLEFIAAAAAPWLAECPAGRDVPDLVVLDPPRSGAAEAMPHLLRLRPRRIVYVSCNPATLARDLRQLAAAYTIEPVQPIDFFPQTYHVEAVATLVLAG